ncbi:MAG: class I SAM-dependent RNA methyltransferase [Candidatus Gracilibacteria bacterium]
MGSQPPLKIRHLNLQTNGVAQNGGDHFEVPFTLQGEVCIPKIVEKKGKTIFALPESITKRSLQRIPPDCMHFTRCGGCHLRHVEYEDSVRIKESVFKKALEKYNSEKKVQEAIFSLNIVAALNPFHYRNTARFYIEDGVLKQHEMLTHENFHMKECYTVSQKTFRKAKEILSLLPETIVELELKENSRGEHMCIISGTLLKELPKIPAESVYLYDREKKAFDHLQGVKTIMHSLHIKENTFQFEIGPDSFFQVNTKMAEELYTHISKYVYGRGVLYDLFAGTGTIGIIMAKIFPKLAVKSVEKNREMVEISQRNAVRNQVKNIEFHQNDVFKMQINEKSDSIIIDPPRKGMDKNALENLMSLQSSQIIYVSCSPATFLRDMEQMLPQYELKNVTLFDMIPYTSHIEVVGIFEKRAL